jgi:hypothetical protein
MDNEDLTPEVEEPKALRTREEHGDLTLLARRHTRRALDVLNKIMEDPTMPAPSRIAAAKELLSRGHGQPVAKLKIHEDLSDTELEVMAKAILDRREKFLEAKLEKAQKLK